MTVKELHEIRDKSVADEIRSGRCPFGRLKPEQTMAHCPLGFPGCGCADEWMVNPYLTPYFPDYTPEPESGVQESDNS